MSIKSNTPAGTYANAFREMMKSVNTVTPGHFIAFTDMSAQRAQIQVGIERVDINGATFRVPPIIDVPVLFIGGDFAVEYQLDGGEEGLIVFGQRCIDGWKQTGGVAANPIGRFFELQDAFFIPGVRSLPNALPDFQNDGIRLRNRSGDQFAWLKRDGSVLVENASGHIRIAPDGVVTINGVTFDTSGNVSSPASIEAAERVTAPTVHGTQDVIFRDISGVNHRHSNVENGPDISGGPV